MLVNCEFITYVVIVLWCHHQAYSACRFYPEGSSWAAMVARSNYPYDKFKRNFEFITFPIIKLRISNSGVTWRCTNITAKERKKSGNAIALLNLYLTTKWINKVVGADKYLPCA